MPNIQSAKKRNRQSVKRRAHNMALRSRARTAMKRVLAAIQKGDHTEAMRIFSVMQSILDKAAKVGIFHRNKVARHKSRLNLKIKALQSA